MDFRRLGHFHTWLYRKTGGRIGAKAGGGREICLLSTLGRKSGAWRTTPLMCMAHGENLIVVASNGGAERDPAWWLNLRAHPEARVRLGSRHWTVCGAQASEQEAAEIWPRACTYNDQWRSYRERTARTIPLVILRPV